MSEIYLQQDLPNGIMLALHPMEAVRSAALTLMVPAGADSDPPGRSGSATVLSDLIFRGAGERSSRQISEDLDSLGINRASGVGVHYTRLGAAATAEQLLHALPILIDLVRRPTLSDDQFELSRELALQSLAGVDDDPRQRLMIKLRETHLPSPFNRNPIGVMAELEALTAEEARADFAHRFNPNGAIIAMAGDIDPGQVADRLRNLTADWTGKSIQGDVNPATSGQYLHDQAETEQIQIGLAFDTIPETHDDYYAMRVALEALGGGTSSRLYVQVREKRGLVYNVSASYSALRGMGSVFCYAGATPQRAQETLDCIIEELRRFWDGINEQELELALVALKSATILAGESSTARSAHLANDLAMRGSIRSMEQIHRALDSVTLEQVNQMLARHRGEACTVVTLGPRQLNAQTRL